VQQFSSEHHLSCLLLSANWRAGAPLTSAHQER
jgi:hypothetical protein